MHCPSCDKAKALPVYVWLILNWDNHQSEIHTPLPSFLSNVFPLANIDTKYSVEDEEDEDEDEDESVANCWAQVKVLFLQFVKFRIREKWSEHQTKNVRVCSACCGKLRHVHYSCPAQCVARLLHAEGDGTQQAELMVE